MKRKMMTAVALLLAATAAVTMSGCRWVRFPTFTETVSIPLKGATSLTAQIEQSVGELTVTPSTTPTDAAAATLVYAPESWKPDVVTSVDASSASFRISSPREDDRLLFGYTRNTWAVTLPAGVSTDLSLDLGVGTSDVDLRGIDLVRLSVRTGVGATSIDLSGARTHDVSVRIQSGVGSLTLRLPRTMGVKVTVPDKGVGDLSARGFEQVSGGWVNAAYSGSGPKMAIELVRGVGDVKLVLTD